jgi:hypothetical protein
VPDGVCVVWVGLLEKPFELVCRRSHLTLVIVCGGLGALHVGATCLIVVAVSHGRGPMKAMLVTLFAAFDAHLGAFGGDVG